MMILVGVELGKVSIPGQKQHFLQLYTFHRCTKLKGVRGKVNRAIPTASNEQKGDASVFLKHP